jgi:type IV pilus biogenesis protein CpaD/CtpE
VAPAQLTFDATGAPAQEITLTTGTACEWTATANRPWITILSGSSGTGSGTIRVSLLVNGDSAVRQGAVAVEGQTVNITQNP